MPRHTRYVKNKRVGSRGTIIRGDQVYTTLGGLVGGAPGQDIHVASAIQRYDLGARRVTGDGRVFRYAKGSNTISRTDFGVKFWNQIGDGIAAGLASAQAIGDTTISIVAAAGATKDEYRGGYVIIHIAAHIQFRGILRNTAAGAGGTTIITLDAPLTVAVDAAQYTEILQSPYSNVRLTAGPSGGDAGVDHDSVAGIPAVLTTAVDMYLWIQTWGPIWINPHGDAGTGVTGGERTLVFDAEGSVCVADESGHGGGTGDDTGDAQRAGFIIDRGGSGPPLVMLQISP